MEHYIIITFDTTASAMAMDKLCTTNNMPGKISNLPGSLRAGCGICYKAPAWAEDQLMELLDANPNVLWDEVYEFGAPE